MRLTVELTFEGNLTLPLHYNHILQGFIYSNLSDRDFAQRLHEQGYSYGRRTFKLFTFSRLLGQYHINLQDSTITFTSPVRLVVASIVEDFVNDLGSTLMIQDELRLGTKQVSVESLKGENQKNTASEVRITTLSPIVTYSTELIHSMKKTIYHKPGDKAFAPLVQQNLSKKYQVIYGHQPPEHEFDLQPMNEKMRINVVKFKDFIIKGWSGDFILKAHPDLIRVGLLTGLGSKNSQGFGCIQLLI